MFAENISSQESVGERERSFRWRVQTQIDFVASYEQLLPGLTNTGVEELNRSIVDQLVGVVIEWES